MYVVTFYSFKGGVGRSMSLVNVGVQLAQSGQKVLLVDFDLEAPGLPTFSLNKPQEDIPGIVEYVSQYVATGESPDVARFIYESERFESGGSICVMPAGRQDGTYSHRLNSIDWPRLYSEHSGYLFFEDLLRQWAESIAPDYVLIDSRTGHSDVEGICTRQLPNAVCLLFFPNEQNLNGLRKIVANINADNLQSSNKKITVHFAVSNVPDLDDEDGILGNTMGKFRQELGYKELAAEIHHYNSLSLLNQEIFSLIRPNSRLTKEYKVLTKSITKNNLGDREAVISILKSANRDLKEVMDEDGPQGLQQKIETIRKNFPQDGEICFRVALILEQLGSSRDALSLLSNEVVDESYSTASMFAKRARLNHRLGYETEAVNDLRAMLDADRADVFSMLEAIPTIEMLAPGLYDRIPDSKAFRSLPEKDQLFFALRSEGNDKQMRANVAILRHLRSSKINKSGEEDFLNHRLALASIGAKEFVTAIEILLPAGEGGREFSITDSFNLAMAIWGRDGTVQKSYFEYVIKKDAEFQQYADAGANYMQCLAISHAVLGNCDRARFFLESSSRKIKDQASRDFSAWSYSKVTPAEFQVHLDEIDMLINGKNVLPRFMRPSDVVNVGTSHS
jgi:MinD-like ATPase involved in chromosome partitioning or flagellar assembly